MDNNLNKWAILSIRKHKELFLIALFCIFAWTPNRLSAQSNCRQWSDGNLTWNDLRLEEFQDTTACSDLHFIWKFRPTKIRSAWNTVENTLFNVTLLDTGKSSHNAARKDDLSLGTDQLLFNIHEVFSRECARRYLQYNNERSLLTFQSTLYAEACETAKNVLMDTNNGRDSVRVMDLSRQYSALLEERDPLIIKKIFPAVSVHWGFFRHSPLGEMSDNLTPGNGFEIGASWSFLYGIVSISVPVNGGKVKTTNKWGNYKNYSNAAFCFDYGYPLVDNSLIQLYPFVGVRAYNLYYLKNDTENLSLNNNSFYSGLCTNIKFFRWINRYDRDDIRRKGISEHGIQLKCYYAKGGSYKKINTNALNIEIGYSYSMDNIFNRF